ncbi:hypothetical protein BH09ACT8_BH09ACT8_42940 [soil metagenome]
MYVDPAGLRSGAGTSYTAADHAHQGAGALSRAAVDSGIFGDFAAARSFQQAAEAAHGRHVKVIKCHIDNLGTIGDKAHAAATSFVEMDDDNAERLGNVY